MTSHLRYDLPVMSLSKPKRPKRGEEWQEPIYDAKDVDWKKGKHGPEFGSVKLTHADEENPKSVVAVFTFDDGDEVTYDGGVPGNGSWKGKGRTTFREGTGKFENRNDEIDVESVNPKRWG